MKVIAFPYHDELQCCWISWRNNSNDDLALYLPKGNVCDMRGAIRMAQLLKKNVSFLMVFCDGVLDVVYKKHKSGKWEALSHRGEQSEKFATPYGDELDNFTLEVMFKKLAGLGYSPRDLAKLGCALLALAAHDSLTQGISGSEVVDLLRRSLDAVVSGLPLEGGNAEKSPLH